MKLLRSKYSVGFLRIFLLMCWQLLGHCPVLFAQHPNKSIRSGNEAFKAKNYTKAKSEYQKALEKNSKSEKALFNAADADYMSGNFEDAAEQFKRLAEKTTDKNLKASSLHNLGNSLLSQKKYPESARAFSDALKLKPDDEQSRYNLAYAKAMMKKEQQQQKQDKNQEQKKDPKHDQNKEKQQQNKDKEDQNKEKNDDKLQSSSDEKKQKKEELSKEDAARLLNAMNKQEKDLHKKLQKKKAAAKANIEKDW